MQLKEVLDAKVGELELLKAEAEAAKESTPSAFIRRIKEIASGAGIDGNSALLAVGRLQEAIRSFDEPERLRKRIASLRAEIDQIRGGLPS